MDEAKIGKLQPHEPEGPAINIEYVIGDITDPDVVGKNTAIIIPGNTSLGNATDFYPNGVQSALLRKTSTNLLTAARQTINHVYGYGETLNNGDMVLVETSRVTGNEEWLSNVPSKIIFAVTMEPDPQTLHRVTEDSVATTIERVLGSSDNLEVDSIAFPLIGTGAMGLPYKAFFNGFKKGVEAYLETHPVPNVKNIKVVIHPSDKQRILEASPNLLPPKL